MRVLILRGLMIAMLALTVSNGVAFAGPFEDAKAVYDRGDYATALQLFLTLATKGNAAAQTQIGWMYELGFGVPKDTNEAVKWYRLGAAKGNLEAQRLLGFVYGTGRGVPKDDKEALKWFRLAAAQGDATAQNKLGELYTKGGDVPSDFVEAVKWFRLAAGQGHEGAQNNLGLMYQRGQGVPQDYILSFMWLIIGKTNLAAVVPTYSARPTPAQFKLAQKMAKRCIDSNYKECGESQGGASTSVPMQMEGDTYVVPVLINNAITLDFIVDSGAADVSIPADVVMTLMRTKTLKEADFLGEQTYVLADGSRVPSQTFVIRSLKVGNKVLENVHGSVASVKGSLLLGQTFLSRFKSWSVDNTKHALLLSE